MRITLEDIKEAVSNEESYRVGEDYYYKNRVGEVHIKQLEDCIEMMTKVEGDTGDYQTRVEIYNKRVSWCECECLPSFHYEGACKHVVAMLLKYYYEVMPQLKKTIRGERYSRNALAYYEEQFIREQDLETSEHNLIRATIKVFDEGAGSFSLGLSVGDKKLYVVKDLYEFAEHMLEGNTVSYGKNLEFIHDISVFDETSRPIVQYIIDKTQEYMDVLRQVGMYRGFTKADRKTLPLGAKAFDEFFDLVRNQKIELVDGSRSREVFCKEGNPKMELSVVEDETQYALETSLKEYEPIQSSRYRYILDEETLYRLDETFGRDVFPILSHMYEARRIHGEKRLEFDTMLMKRFMISSLSKLERHVLVKMSEEVKTAVAPENVTIKAFLDLDDEGNVIGDIQFQYKHFSFNPYKHLTDKEEKALSQIARDTPHEYQLNSVLKNYDFRTQKGRLHLDDEEQIYYFLREGIRELMAISEVHVTERLKHVNVVRSPIGRVGLRIENNMLHVALKEINMPLEEVQEALRAYKLKSKYYRLKSGSFIDLEKGKIGDLANIVEGLGISDEALLEGEAILPKYRALYLDQILKQSEEIEVNRDKYFKQIIRDVRNVEDADYEVPDKLQANLRAYQKTGYRWLKTMAEYGFGGILADDMGLGKTLQVITLIASDFKKTSLVVCPTSLALNWESEFKKFAPHLKVLVVMGTIEERKGLLQEVGDYHVIVTSYELLKRDIEYYEKLDFRCCIADEAQYIKNANTLSAKALKMLRGEVRFALTGTPIENSLAELWSIFDFIMPGYLFGYNRFKRDFEMPIVKSQDEVTTGRLKKMISPFILRRLKKDVLKELPEKTETVIYNTMEDEQKKLYIAHLAQAKAELEEEFRAKGVGRSQIKMLSLLTRLRQLCCHPALYLQDYESGSGKLEQCMEIIRDSMESGHKILLFSQFTSMLDIISEELSKDDIEHFMLTGSTKAEERIHLVERFNTSDIPVFLISLKAGGTGLNLTGADVVIHYDPWWNLSSQNQATDRAYRIGQKNNVQVFQMITRNSIEEKIKELQDKKIGLTESVLQEGESFISKMSEEEIRDLFS